MTYCDNCDYVAECDIAYEVNFCDHCKNCWICSIKGVCCEAGHDIECNNGFEIDFDDFDDDDDDWDN